MSKSNTIIEKIGVKLDSLFYRFPRFFRFCCFFFENTSKLTKIILFNDFCFIIFSFFIVFYVYYNIDIIRDIVLNVKLLGISQLFLIIYNSVFHFNLFLLAIFIFYYIISINTCLACSKKITSFMQNKYHSDILKSLGYNGVTSSFTKSASVILGAMSTVAIIEVGQTIRTNIVSGDWSTVAKQAIEHKQPIPENPISIVSHTVVPQDINSTMNNIGKQN